MPSLDRDIYGAIDLIINPLTAYPAFKKLEGKRSAFKKKYLALAKKRIREITGKKRIRSDMYHGNLEPILGSWHSITWKSRHFGKAPSYNIIISETLEPFYEYMTKLLHKHVFGKPPTPAQMQSYKSHKIVHDVYGHWGNQWRRWVDNKNRDYERTQYTLLARAFDKIRVMNPGLFKKKIAVWEKKALNNLPSDAITFENFKSGDKAIHLGYGRYISPNTFRRLEKDSKTADEVYETYNMASNWTTSRLTMVMKDPYTRKALKRTNVEFVTLYKKSAPKKPSPKKIAAATKIQARVRGIRNRKYAKNLKQMITVAAAARKARERTAAATKIQARARGIRNRKKVAKMKASPKKTSPPRAAAAATKIQARARGIRNRKKVAKMKANNQRTKILKALQARGL